MRGRLLAGGVALGAALLCVLVPAAGGRSALAYRILLERVQTTLYLTVTNQGAEPIGLVALRGGDFPITGANAVGGGPAVCQISGNPATVTCRNFQLQQGKTLTVLIATSGTATQALYAVTTGAEPRDIDFFPLAVEKARPRGTAQVKKLSAKRIRLVLTNTGFVPIKKVFIIFKKKNAVRRIVSLHTIQASAGPRCHLFVPRVRPGYKPHQEIDCDGLESFRQYIIEMQLLHDYVQSVFDGINGVATDGQPASFGFR